VAEAEAPRDGRFVERIGFYNPLAKSDKEEKFSLSEERARYWLSVGVQPTERVSLFLARAGVIPAPQQPTRPHKSQPKKKAQERAKAAAAESSAA
jgi:small subunit ribosomal protein S16